MKKIVFLCDGNTCRSPMAEGLFKKMVKNADISSAGFANASGEDPSDYTILVCNNKGIDLSDFTTTNIADVDFDSVDLVLTATVHNKNKIMKMYPNLNAHTIKEYSGMYEDTDITDPATDGGLGEYVVCYFEIKEALERILEAHPEKFKRL